VVPDLVPAARTADRGVPRRDREGEETSARLLNGDAQLGDLMCRQRDMSLRVGDLDSQPVRSRVL
jgi:hypothetical protein